MQYFSFRFWYSALLCRFESNVMIFWITFHIVFNGDVCRLEIVWIVKIWVYRFIITSSPTLIHVDAIITNLENQTMRTISHFQFWIAVAPGWNRLAVQFTSKPDFQLGPFLDKYRVCPLELANYYLPSGFHNHRISVWVHINLSIFNFFFGRNCERGYYHLLSFSLTSLERGRKITRG